MKFCKYLKFWSPGWGPSINYVVSMGEGVGVKNCQFYLVKRRLRGGGGKIADFETTKFMDGPLHNIDIAGKTYGQPVKSCKHLQCRYGKVLLLRTYVHMDKGSTKIECNFFVDPVLNVLVQFITKRSFMYQKIRNGQFFIVQIFTW